MRPEAHTAHEDLFIRRSQSLLPSDSSVSTFGKVGSLLFFLIEAKLVDVLRVPAAAQWLLCSEPNGCSLHIIYVLAYRGVCWRRAVFLLL